MRNYFMRRKLTKMPRQKLWMLMSFALYTGNDEIVAAINDEISQRNFLGKR